MSNSQSSPYSPSGSADAAHPFNRTDADIILRSTDSVDFRVHRAVLEISSPFFGDGLDALDKRNIGMTAPDQGCLPICHIYAHSDTLNVLLHHIYPLPTPEILTVDEAFRILSVSREYDFRLVTGAVKKTIFHLAEVNPLEIYALAALRGWEEEMRMAARLSLRHSIHEVYVGELEELSAGTYHRLLAYHRLCGQVASNVIDNLDWMADMSSEGDRVPTWFTCKLCPFFRLETSTDGKDHGATSWFHTLLLLFKQALRSKLCGSTIGNSELSEPCLGEAMACSECRTTANSDLERLVAKLREEINRAVAKVRLTIA